MATTQNDMRQCDCQSENSVECAGLKQQPPLSFYKALGFGHDCSCSCHVHSDEQTIENFKRFLREMSERGIHPIIPQEMR